MGDLDYVIRHTWLNHLDEATLAQIRASLERVQLKQGDVLFAQGEPGDSMYAITEGMVEVLVQDEEGDSWLVALRGRGDFIGEMALITGQKRTATVKAAEDSELWGLDKAVFDNICSNNREILRQLGDYMGPKLQMIQLVSVMSGLFGVLDMATLMDLETRLSWKHLPSGETLASSAEPQGSMFIIVNGRLRVELVRPDGGRSHLGYIGRGDTVGEFNLLTGENKEILLTALRDADLVRLSQDVIESLLEKNPSSVLRFVRRTASRMESAERTGRASGLAATTFALFPLDESVPVTDVAAQIAKALAPYGSIAHLSSERFDRQYGREGAAQTRVSDPTNISIVHWLSVQEHAHTFVIYECDPGSTPWTRRCLRQADRILLVGLATGRPGPGRGEQSLLSDGYAANQELVLLHPSSTLHPSNTREWLQDRNLRAHHHLRLEVPGDVERLARRLIGKEIALVLSGGGARGFAHAGVFRALEEAGIPVDLIAGTSMGALVGGALAQGDGYTEIMTFARQYGSPSTLFDFTLPLVSFLASYKLTRMLQDIFGKRLIEDLWRPFFCISADLTKARPIVHREGPVWEAIRGSLALPGIFSPFPYRGSLVVDGGVMNNTPIDLMREAYPGAWIAGVNVNPTTEMLEDYTFGPGISGLRVLFNKLNPLSGKTKVPSIFSTLTRSTEIKGIYQMEMVRDMADLIIQPDVSSWGFMDFRPAVEIADAGYRATLARTDEIVADLQDKGFQLS